MAAIITFDFGLRVNAYLWPAMDYISAEIDVHRSSRFPFYSIDTQSQMQLITHVSATAAVGNNFSSMNKMDVCLPNGA